VKGKECVCVCLFVDLLNNTLETNMSLKVCVCVCVCVGGGGSANKNNHRSEKHRNYVYSMGGKRANI